MKRHDPVQRISHHRDPHVDAPPVPEGAVLVLINSEMVSVGGMFSHRTMYLHTYRYEDAAERERRYTVEMCSAAGG